MHQGSQQSKKAKTKEERRKECCAREAEGERAQTRARDVEGTGRTWVSDPHKPALRDSDEGMRALFSNQCPAAHTVQTGIHHRDAPPPPACTPASGIHLGQEADVPAHLRRDRAHSPPSRRPLHGHVVLCAGIRAHCAAGKAQRGDKQPRRGATQPRQGQAERGELATLLTPLGPLTLEWHGASTSLSAACSMSHVLWCVPLRYLVKETGPNRSRTKFSPRPVLTSLGPKKGPYRTRTGS